MCVCIFESVFFFSWSKRMTSSIRSLRDPAEIMQAGWKTVVLKIIKPTITNPLQHSSSLFFRKQHMPGYIYQYSILCSLRNGRLLSHPLSWVRLPVLALSSQHSRVALCWQPCLGGRRSRAAFLCPVTLPEGSRVFLSLANRSVPSFLSPV